MHPDLSTQDSARLAELEVIITRGLGTFIEVGRALLEIRTQRLYRATHPTFEAYCRERWGWSRIHAHRQIQAAQVAALLPMGNTPATERQARELVPVLAQGPEAVRAVWTEATETNADPTAADVRAAVQRRLTPEEDWEAWAEAQLAGPFTREDFDDTRWITTKLLHHVCAPAVTSCLLAMAQEYKVPALQLAPGDELVEFLRCVVPYAKDARRLMRFESEMTQISTNDYLHDRTRVKNVLDDIDRHALVLQLHAMRICGFVLHELERREKARRLNRHQPSREAVHRQLMQRIDDALARLGAGAHPAAP